MENSDFKKAVNIVNYLYNNINIGKSKHKINYSTEECVDFVILSDNETATNVIKKIKPNFYVKGKDYQDLSKDITKNIYKEKSAVEKNNGQLIFTDDIQFSSSNIINSFYKPENILSELKKLKIDKKKLSYECISSLKKIENLKVGIIGEIIFDEYIFQMKWINLQKKIFMQ